MSPRKNLSSRMENTSSLSSGRYNKEVDESRVNKKLLEEELRDKSRIKEKVLPP